MSPLMRWYLVVLATLNLFGIIYIILEQNA